MNLRLRSNAWVYCGHRAVTHTLIRLLSAGLSHTSEIDLSSDMTLHLMTQMIISRYIPVDGDILRYLHSVSFKSRIHVS